MNDTYRERQDGMARLLVDLDRCTHGRHEGDACAGWRGPGPQDGGCQGGFSLGNPYLPAPGGRIGTTMYGKPIIIPERGDRHLPEAWIR